MENPRTSSGANPVHQVGQAIFAKPLSATLSAGVDFPLYLID